ncbi:hypothetical protein Moror_2809 [Moniliophthora roreri MCA 2997]|uniref:Uncharacterized protein n=2 Tax=Moniliophthora roreri TaxID=221103 RepID=V2XET4_MONRO|nr:hypothetical protein Moror_2809 [Moniliophthora roreri MCA 2997]KAI3598040.1 hypothetical protein WG66_009116 [Moniliophthora roreri]
MCLFGHLSASVRHKSYWALITLQPAKTTVPLLGMQLQTVFNSVILFLLAANVMAAPAPVPDAQGELVARQQCTGNDFSDTTLCP